MKIKITLLIALVVISLTVAPIMEGVSVSDSPLNEDPSWTRAYDEEDSLYIIPVHENEVLVINEDKLELLNSAGEIKWTQNFSYQILIFPKIKEDTIYMMTGSFENDTYYIHCLDRESGDILWNKYLDFWGLNIMVNEDGDIFIPHFDEGGNITKISSNKKIIWTKKFSESSYAPTSAFILNEKLYVVYSRPDHNLLCIGLDGDVEWEFKIPNEDLISFQFDRTSKTYFTSTPKAIYRLDVEGESENLYEMEDGSSIQQFRYVNHNFYILSNKNKTPYLTSVSYEGKILWKERLDQLTNPRQKVIISMNPDDCRLYCLYRNITEDNRYRFYKVQAFDERGKLRWEHEYEKETIHQIQVLDNIIVIRKANGEIYAYETQALEEDGASNKSMYIILSIFILVVGSSSWVFLRKRGSSP